MNKYNEISIIGLFTIQIILLFIYTGHSFAQSTSSITLSDAEYVVEKAYNTENGLPANGVNTLLQDSRGYIWIATYNGLVRFDGHRKKIYNTSNIEGLGSNRFIVVSEDKYGRIWAGLEYNNLVVIDGRNSTVYQIDDDLISPNTYITRISFGQNDTKWIGTSRGLVKFKNGDFQRIENLPVEAVQHILQDGEKIYVLFDNSLYQLDQNGNTEEIIFELFEDEIHHTSGYKITEFSNVTGFRDWIKFGDDYALVHEAGIVIISDHGYEILLDKSDIGYAALHRMKQFGDIYYLFGSNGLVELRNIGSDNLEIISYSNYSSSDIMVDHEGSVWLGTRAHGVRKFIQTPVYQGDDYKILTDKAITAILEGQNNELWVGINCDGLYEFREGNYRRYGSNEGILNTCIWSVMEQSDGTLWAGTWGAGAFYRPPGMDNFIRFNPEKFEDVEAVLSIYEDSNGIIWIGSYYSGLFKYDGTEIESIKNDRGENVSAIRMIHEEENGNILIATDRGIGYLSDDVIIKPEEFNQLQNRNFRTINKDSDGRFWFGSYGGGILIYSSGSEVFKLTTQNGLFDDTVSQVAFDPDGNVWLGGNLGMFYIEKEQLDLFFEGSIDEVRVSRIGVAEGLVTRETTGGFMPSSQLNQHGELFIPTVQGLEKLHINQIQLNRELPKIYIEEIEIDDQIFNYGEVFSIPYDAQRVIFRFTALSFKNPENVKFEYIMEGVDSRWHKSENVREVVYTTLQPGDYTFRVRGANNDGFWNHDEAGFSFTVAPPFWNTLWFYLISGLLLVAIVIGGYRKRVKNIRRYNLILQNEVEERTRELKASNYELKNLIEEKNKLHRILAHDLRNPFTAILGYIDLLKHNYEENGDKENVDMMEMLLDSGRSTLNLLENLLSWSGVKSGGLDADIVSTNINCLIDEAIKMVEAQASFKNIKVLSHVHGNLQVMADHNLILTVMRNLISNAIKFSGKNSTVDINLKNDQDFVTISISDTGVGIPERELNELFESDKIQHKLGTKGETGIGMGLQLCKEFIDKHRGRIWVESELGKGSTFYFTLEKEIGKEIASTVKP